MTQSARQLLLIRSSQPENVYGRFTAEILKSEGFNGFEIVDLDTQPFPAFEPDTLIVLTRCFLRNSEMDMLQDAITSGARMVCFQPSWSLAERFGMKSKISVLRSGWIRIHDGYPGSGVPIQTHMPIALYEVPPGSGHILADAVDSEWKTGGGPAVVRGSMGKGKWAFFFYDLPCAVARIRFGDPELASLLTSGHWRWTHASDLFDGHTDPRVLRVPQADFHCQLLAKVLTDIAPYPLPRLWYYPCAEHRSACVFQSDDDLSTWEQFTELSDSLLRHDAKGTFYLMRQTLLTDEQVKELRSKGHTFAPHVFANDGVEDLYFRFGQILPEHTLEFKKQFGACSPSLQCHYAPWMGYMSWVPLHMEHGYRLLFAYMSSPSHNLNTFLCGSGRPMRFFDRNGTLYDCRQQPVPTYDDSSIKEQATRDPQSLVGQFEKLLASAVERTHTAFAISSHPVSFATYSRPFIEGCFDALYREGAPILNADEWIAFLDRREAVCVSHTETSETSLSFTVSNLAGSIPLMIPVKASMKVAVNGREVPTTRIRRLEEDYLVIPLEGDGKDISITVGK